VPQRVVRTHPGSHRKTLYLAAHASHILGLPVADGRLIILDLIEHATQPRFVHAHRWAKGDLVIWDNRCTMHRARPFDTTKVRDLRRVTTRDVASTLEQAA
jgi:alpha-ketoglutarate-dependent 2,4-dichlorophenoxyacetate dioxygenase